MTGGGFVKIYGSILDSSIWSTDLVTRVVWITMLAMADRDGYVNASTDGIARRANVTLDDCEAALKVLRSPDRLSKSKDYEGRRIRKADRGWLILNYANYREMRTQSQMSEAERKRAWRKSKQHKADETGHVPDVPECPTVSRAEAEAEADRETTTTASPVPEKRRSGPPPYDALFEEAWAAYPKRPNNNKSAAWRQWLARVGEGVDPLDMLEGARRYATLVAREQTDPRFVKMGATFFGRDRHFANDYAPGPDPLAHLPGYPNVTDEYGCFTPYGEAATRPAGIRVA